MTYTVKPTTRFRKDLKLCQKRGYNIALYAGLEGAACGLRSNETPESRLIKGVRKAGVCLPENRAEFVQKKINLPVP